MSEIGAPPSTIGKHQYGTDPYGYGTGGASGAQDPYAAGGGEAFQAPEMQAYVQQLYYYHTMYQQMLYSATDPNQINQLRQYDSQVLQYLQQVGAPPPQEGMPFGGDPNAAPGTQQEPSQYTNTPPDYQTKDAVVFEEGASSNATIDRQDPDKREANYYQPSNVCNIPSNAAMVKVTMQPDDANPTDQMAVVEITFHNPDGSTETRIVKYHGANREGFQLAINTPSTEQADLTAIPEEYKDKIKWGDTAGPQELKGDPPTDMDGDTRVYDGQSFEISPVPTGKDEETNVLANGNVTITPNSNNEYYEVSYTDGPPKEYTIKVYNSLEDKEAGTVKETIHVDADLVDKINFGCDPSRIEFKDNLADPSDPHAINPEPGADGPANKLALGGAGGGWEEGEPINPDSPADSAPTRVSGDTAVYEDDANVELTNYWDGNVDTYNITASGTVTIHPDKQSDHFKITTWYDDNGDLQYKIVVTNPNEPGKEITYTVAADQVDQINIADVDPAQIEFGTSTQITEEQKAKIQIGGEAQGTGTDAQAIIDGLKELSGRTDAQLLSAINSNGYYYDNGENKGFGPFDSIEDLKAAIQAGTFPPKTLANPHTDMEYQNSDLYKMFNLIGMIDPQIQSILHQPIDSRDYKGINDRFIAYFEKLYPNAIVTDTSDVRYAQGKISISGVSTGDLHWQYGSDNFNVTFEE